MVRPALRRRRRVLSTRRRQRRQADVRLLEFRYFLAEDLWARDPEPGEWPTVAVQDSRAYGDSEDLLPFLALVCTGCGELSDPMVGSEAKNRLARSAFLHAEEVHDGLVDRVGWV